MKKVYSNWIYLILAVAIGFAVSSIYLNQTILSLLAQVFSAQPSDMGLLSTATQLGYAAGIFFLVPIGDIVSKKRLAVIKLGVLALALVAMGFSQQLWQLFVASLAVGILASVTQDMVPLAAEMAPVEQRGQKIGLVMSGLLVGILASRTISGLIEHELGWCWVFWSFAGFVALCLLAVIAFIPMIPASNRVSYRQLLNNLFQLLLREPKLRRAIWTHGLVGMAFSAFWTNLSFYLAGPQFHLTTTQIGLFGLAGAVGALLAPITGKFADVHGPQFGIRLGIGMVVAGFALMFALSGSLVAMVVGVVLFDAGTQMSLVSHQSIIYGLNSEARSSLNALFITGLFLSFSIGSALSAQVQTHLGWQGVLGLAIILSSVALLRAFNQPLKPRIF